MAAMEQVPRHEFVPPEQEHNAYENRPLPIGYGQTISQPYIVALMTDLMLVKPDRRRARDRHRLRLPGGDPRELARAVYSIEIVEPLALQARSACNGSATRKVETRVGDGYYGWEDHAPYDAIIVTAAASHVPPRSCGN